VVVVVVVLVVVVVVVVVIVVLVIVVVVIAVVDNLYHRTDTRKSINSDVPRRIIRNLSSSSSLARQPYVGPGLPQKRFPAKVSGYCFFRLRDKCIFQGEVVSHKTKPLLSWRANAFCQGCLT
jgi:hypothetical protein